MRPGRLSFCCAAILWALAAGPVSAQEAGPLGDPGQTIAKPKRPPVSDTGAPADAGATTDLPKIPSEYKKDKTVDTTGLATFKTDVDIVSVNVAVMDSKGNFIPSIPSGNFRVLEDNVPQPISKVVVGEAPLTVALLIEFSNKFQQFYGPAWFQTLNLVWGFAGTLKPQDFVAVIAYDMKPEILSDFTTDRAKTEEALHRLTIPGFSEANLFDALTDTADRMSGIEGRKAILLVTSGIDTFSKLTFDKTRKLVQDAGVPIYAIGLLQMLRERADSMGRLGAMQRMDFLQADNELKTFCKESGGRAFFPMFQGENGEIFSQIQQSLRSQYIITYSPSNKAHDGSYRRLKVELIGADGNPLPIKDEKGKPVKYTIVAKAGYKAPNAVE
jgi:Ca-activated chloride channel family protein